MQINLFCLHINKTVTQYDKFNELLVESATNLRLGQHPSFIF